MTARKFLLALFLVCLTPLVWFVWPTLFTMSVGPARAGDGWIGTDGHSPTAEDGLFEVHSLANRMSDSRRDARRRLAALETVAQHMTHRRPLSDEHAAELQRAHAEIAEIQQRLTTIAEMDDQLMDIRQRLELRRSDSAASAIDTELMTALRSLSRWSRQQDLLADTAIPNRQWRTNTVSSPTSTPTQERKR